MSVVTRDHVFAALRAAGPDGLTANQIAEAVSLTRGKRTSRESVWKLLVTHLAERDRLPRLRCSTAGRVQCWTIVADVADPTPLPPPEIDEPATPPPILAWPRSLTAALMGDPLPGRSAWDTRDAGTGADRHA